MESPRLNWPDPYVVSVVLEFQSGLLRWLVGPNLGDPFRNRTSVEETHQRSLQDLQIEQNNGNTFVIYRNNISVKVDIRLEYRSRGPSLNNISQTFQNIDWQDSKDLS